MKGEESYRRVVETMTCFNINNTVENAGHALIVADLENNTSVRPFPKQTTIFKFKIEYLNVCITNFQKQLPLAIFAWKRNSQAFLTDLNGIRSQNMFVMLYD